MSQVCDLRGMRIAIWDDGCLACDEMARFRVAPRARRANLAEAWSRNRETAEWAFGCCGVWIGRQRSWVAFRERDHFFWLAGVGS
jgi:hypothetical protein